MTDALPTATSGLTLREINLLEAVYGRPLVERAKLRITPAGCVRAGFWASERLASERLQRLTASGLLVLVNPGIVRPNDHPRAADIVVGFREATA